MTRFVINASVVLVAVMIGFGLIEAALHVLPGTPVSDERRSHFIRTNGSLYARKVEPYHIALKPSTVATIETAEYRLQYFINSLGFREYEFTREKPDGTLRVAVVGDSITFGTGVELEQTFVKKLEEKLNARPEFKGQKVEVLNLGVGAASAGQNLLRLRHDALELELDLAIYVYYANDAMEWPYYSDDQNRLPKSYVVSGEYWESKRNSSVVTITGNHPVVPPDALIWLSGRSRAAELALAAWTKHLNPPLQSPGLNYVLGDPWNDPFWPFRLGLDLDKIPEWQTHCNILRATVGAAKAAGIPLLAAVLPTGALVADYEWAEGRRFHGFYPDKTYSDKPLKKVTRVLQEAGAETLYLTPVLSASSQPGRRMFFSFDGHLSPDGHEVVAVALEPLAVKLLEKE